MIILAHVKPTNGVADVAGDLAEVRDRISAVPRVETGPADTGLPEITPLLSIDRQYGSAAPAAEQASGSLGH